MGETDTLTKAIATPPFVRGVCAGLQRAGHQAYAVGGAVRDALLGRTADDWDIATSATPEEVMSLFPRCLPTGLPHGTVTVLVDDRGHRAQVEVTTFRGEGEYVDGRRPSQVQFGVPLHEDLARRDLTINAMAYDPMRDEFVDPFGGRADLSRRVIRAVGDPAVRLQEDGLRVMRVVRFAATLGFSIHASTESALGAAIPSLRKVAPERIKTELWKLLSARDLAAVWPTLVHQGIASVVLPELGPWAETPQAMSTSASLTPFAVDSKGDGSDVPEARLAYLCARRHPDANEAVASAGRLARRLRCSRAEESCLTHIVDGLVFLRRRGASCDVAASCEILSRVSRAHLGGFWVAAAAWLADTPEAASVQQVLRQAQNAPLSTQELALAGAELLEDFQQPAGPWIGKLQRELLVWVWQDPVARNDRNALRVQARALMAER